MSKELKHKWSEHVNSVIALCAILMSGASFYATWLKADAADKQVIAMTLPLVSFEHGNILSDGKTPGIRLQLHNGGLGPAVLHSATFVYEGNHYKGLGEWFAAWCSDAKAQVLE